MTATNDHSGCTHTGEHTHHSGCTHHSAAGMSENKLRLSLTLTLAFVA